MVWGFRVSGLGLGHGFFFPRFGSALVWLPWSSGPLVLWSPGPLVPWSSGSWCFGPLVLVGFVALGFLASVASWLLGFSGSWLLGFLAPWLLGFGGSLASQDLNNFISRMAT